jgi:hypothetical protein
MGYTGFSFIATPWYSLQANIDNKRKITDVICIIIGVIFGLALFIAAIIMYNKANLHLADYPADSKGNVCAINAFDAKGRYPFLYFNDLTDPLSER